MTKIKAKNQELIDLLQSLYAVQDLKGVSFAIAVTKNIDKLQKDLQYLEDAAKPTEEFQKIVDEVNTISNTEKDEEVAKTKIAEIEKEHEVLVEERKAQLDEVAKVLEEETEIELTTINRNSLPQDITAKQIGALKKIINL
jgi:septal ring factor EnvC (AmiA/AmiB activator)